MARVLDPVPHGQTRSDVAKRVRVEAAEIAEERVAVAAQANNHESETLDPPFGTFTKGLKHDAWGGLATGADLDEFISEINQDKPGSGPNETPLPKTWSSKKPAPFDVSKYPGSPVPPYPFAWPVAPGAQCEGRGWESPLAGHVFEINGPDADQVGVPPAPTIGSYELTAEMAELYAMALLRDEPFSLWEDGGAIQTKVQEFVDLLNAIPFIDVNGKADDGSDIETALTPRETARRHARYLAGGPVTVANVFRGSTYGAQVGPYVSQFLLIGNAERTSAQQTAPAQQPAPCAAAAAAPAEAAGSVTQDAATRPTRFVPSELARARAARGGDFDAQAFAPGEHPPVGREAGYIRYGQQVIPQYFVPHMPGRDHMTDHASWLDVQNGADRREFDYFLQDPPFSGDVVARFALTPRDLTTYVHFDVLYQAYLNACLILLGEKTPTDVGLPEGKGHPTRDAFATFGGPHIQTIVTEVATRALKAVRRQKYQVHLRARPEAVAGAVALAWNAQADAGLDPKLGNVKAELDKMVAGLSLNPGGGASLLERISQHNADQNAVWSADGWPVDLDWIDQDRNALLPMAFPEGSPMHPAYGAGHATVAGACVTVLKAFFEMFKVPDAPKRGDIPYDDLIAEGSNPNSPYFGGAARADWKSLADVKITDAYEANPGDSGQTLRPIMPNPDLTLQGELDKLAGNIAIARNFAGVHYYTDYYESLRLGERVAVGLLQEQMLTYREPVTMRFTSFDGDRILIVGTGGSRHGAGDPKDALVYVWNEDGSAGGDDAAFEAWWRRAQ